MKGARKSTRSRKSNGKTGIRLMALSDAPTRRARKFGRPTPKPRHQPMSPASRGTRY